MALPKRPPVTRVGPFAALNVPLLLLPLLSMTVVPLASSKPNEAPGANGVTVTLAAHEVVWFAESVTFSVTAVVPGVYGPGGTCASVIGPPSGSNEPLLIDAVAVPMSVAATVTGAHWATGGGSTIVIVNDCGALVLTPPLAVPPLSLSVTVTLATPTAPAAPV